MHKKGHGKKGMTKLQEGRHENEQKRKPKDHEEFTPQSRKGSNARIVTGRQLWVSGGNAGHVSAAGA